MLCIFDYLFNELGVLCSTFVLCALCVICVWSVYHVCVFFNTFFMNLLCACVFFGGCSLLFYEHAVCVSAFLVCVLCVCFVYGVCTLHGLPMRCFVNLLRAFLHLSCVFCVYVALGLCAIFVCV